MSFQINGRKFLLTYAQCPLTKEEILEALRLLSEVDSYAIGRELHIDQRPHSHAAVQFSKAIRTRDSRLFDIKGYHPNIKTLRTKADLERAQVYATKDGDFIRSDPETKSTKRQALFRSILEAGTITPDFIKSNPDVLGLNFSSISGWLSLYKGPPTLPTRTPMPKKRHIFVHGPSNTGKSTWLYAFLKDKKAVPVPLNNDWRMATVDTEVLYCDEYEGHLRVQLINTLCDGCITLNTKGGSTMISQPLVILVSNYTFEELHPHVKSVIRDSFYNRFNIYDSSISLP